MATSTIAIDRPTDGVVVMALNRPDRLNAINEVMVDELRSTCDWIAGDDGVRAIVLTGTGRGFCSGLDLRDFGASIPDADAPALDRMRFQERMAGLPALLRALPQPVVAAVNGPAVGGGMALCLASDLRVCGASASFGNAAIKLGLTGTEMGMSYLLPRIVGTSIAAEWMLTGRPVDAEEALRTGLVSALLDDTDLLRHAIDLAGQIAGGSALAVQMTKRTLQLNVDAPTFDAAIEIENRNQLITHATDEAAAARAAWEAR